MSQSKNARRKRRQDRSADRQPGSAYPLQDFMDRVLREVGETPTRRAARTARFAALAREQPAKYVAYREVWDGDVLTEPFVLAVGDSFADVGAKLAAAHPPEVQAAAVIRWVSPPGRPLVPDSRTRHRLPRPAEVTDAPPD